MSSTNIGNQLDFWKYKTPINSNDFDKIFKDIFSPGVCGGFTITKDSDSQVSISTGNLIISDGTYTSLKCTTSTVVLNTISSSIPWIVYRWQYTTTQNYYGDFLCVNHASILSTDVILGKAIYNGSTLSSISIQGRTYSNLKNWNDVWGRFKVTEKSTPAMKAIVAPGSIVLADGNRYSINQTELTIEAADPSNPRIDLIGIDNSGNLNVINGIPASSPVAPSYSGYFGLAEIYVAANVTAIYNENITDVRSFFTTPYDLQSVINFTDTRYYNRDDADKKELQLKERLEKAENKNLQQDIELGYLMNRQNTTSDEVIELFVDRNNFDKDYETNSNKVVKIMDDNDYNNNWEKYDGKRLDFKNGYITNEKQTFMLEIMDEYDLTNVGQVNKCSIKWDSTNNCYWLMTNAGTNGIGEIIKLSKYMEKGKVEVIGNWFLPISGANKTWTGIASDGTKLWIISQSNGTAGVESTIYGFAINNDNSLGATNYKKKPGETIDLTNSPYAPAVTSATGVVWNDVDVWDSNNLVILLCNGTTAVTLVSTAKANLGAGIGVANQTGLVNYVGGTTSINRSLFINGNDIFVRVNDSSDSFRQIYRFHKTNDIKNNVFIKCSGRFISRATGNGTGNGGITVSATGDILEVISNASTCILAKESFKNALWAENQIIGEFKMLTDSHPTDPSVPGNPKACMVDSSGNYWTGETGQSANTAKIYKYKTDGTVKSSILTNKSWTGLIDLCTDGTNVYLLGTDGTNYQVFYGTLASLNLLVDGSSAVSLGSTWGTSAAGIGLTNTKVLTGLAYDSDRSCLWIVNDTDDKIGKLSTVSTAWDTWVNNTLDLPAPSNSQWSGLAWRPGLLYIVDNHTSTTFDKIYILNLDIMINSTSAWYREHIHQQPAPTGIAASIFGIDFDSTGNLVLTHSGNTKFYNMITLSNPNALQLQYFLDSNNVLLSDNASTVTPIQERYFDIEDYSDKRNVPGKYYSVVGYGDNGFSILNLDEFLSYKNTSGLTRYYPSKIRTNHFKKGLEGIYRTTNMSIGKLFSIEDLILDINNGIVKETVDSTGNVGYNLRIALDSNDYVHICYLDVSNQDLKYATNKTGSWVVETLDSTNNVGSLSSIAIDSNNYVHICYLYDTGFDLKYVTNKTGSWVISTVDSAGKDGMPAIALDSNNYVHISYYEYNSTPTYLKYATNKTGSWVVDTVDTGSTITGQYSSIAIDSNNYVHISYLDVSNQDLKYATNKTGSWVVDTVDSTGESGRYSSIVIDSNNFVYISYQEYLSNNLKYATNKTGSWVVDTVDSTGDVGSYCEIALDSNNLTHISYYGNSTLKYATNKTGSWVVQTLDSTGDVGYSTSIKIDSNDYIHIGYYDNSNGDLKYLTYNKSLLINLFQNKINNLNSGRYFSGSISEKSNNLSFLGSSNSNLNLSSFNCYSISSRTFNKYDVSNYSLENKKTYTLIGTDNGVDLMIIDWDENGNRTLLKTINNIFNSTTIGRYANWIAPDGTIFAGDYTVNGKIYKHNKKVWEIVSDNDGSSTEIGTNLGSGYVMSISPNSVAYKNSTGDWKYYLYISVYDSASGGIYGTSIIDIQNSATIKIDTTETGSQDISTYNIDNNEDYVYSLVGLTLSTTEKSGYLNFYKRLRFNDGLVTTDKNYFSKLYNIQDTTRPYFNMFKYNTTGKSNNLVYSKLFNQLLVCSTSGLQAFCFEKINKCVWKSGDIELDFNPRNVHFSNNDIIESGERTNLIAYNNINITYTNGNQSWGGSVDHKTVLYDVAVQASLSKNITGKSRVGIWFKRTSSSCIANLLIQNTTDNTTLINNATIDLYMPYDEDLIYWVDLNSAKNYTITVSTTANKNALSSNGYLDFYGLYETYNLLDSNIVTTLSTYDELNNSIVYTYSLTKDITTSLIKQQTFNGNNSNKVFTLSGNNKAYEFYRISPDNGNTWYYSNSYSLTWGSNNSDYDDEIIYNGYFSVKLNSAPGTGTGNVIIEYIPLVNKAYINLELDNLSDESDATYFDNRRKFLVSDFGLEFLK